jgi:hypothetical protein
VKSKKTKKATSGCALTLRENTCPIRTSVVSTKKKTTNWKRNCKRNKRVMVGDWGGKMEKWESLAPRREEARKEGLLFGCAASPTMVCEKQTLHRSKSMV